VLSDEDTVRELISQLCAFGEGQPPVVLRGCRARNRAELLLRPAPDLVVLRDHRRAGPSN
jgi:hypothetical protein